MEPTTPAADEAALVNVRSPVDCAAEAGQRPERPGSYAEAEIIPGISGGYGFGVAIGPAGIGLQCDDEPQQWQRAGCATSTVSLDVLSGGGQARITNFSVVVEKLTGTKRRIPTLSPTQSP